MEPSCNIEDSGLTMLDVLEQEKELEEEYAAVLGASDEKSCTYARGAIKRQALYSCLTCCPDSFNKLEKCAGICLACSYNCHEGHELLELYTKRNFRCDCPTKRLGDNRCILNSNLKQQPVNEDNVYNQNFQGLYCTCRRPYPDPLTTTEQFMIQCAICEDWFHLQHLDMGPDVTELVNICSEMICQFCMNKHDFLWSYKELALNTYGKLRNSENNKAPYNTTAGKLCLDEDRIADVINVDDESDRPYEQSSKRLKLECGKTIETASEGGIHSEMGSCRRPTSEYKSVKGAVFWGNEWRAALCRCKQCLTIYKSEHVEFLLDTEDPAKCYEERGMKRDKTENSTYEEGIRALASIGHVQKIEVITEYNRMKEKLKKYLNVFAVNKKIVTEEDIKSFFRQINEKRKQEKHRFP